MPKSSSESADAELARAPRSDARARAPGRPSAMSSVTSSRSARGGHAAALAERRATSAGQRGVEQVRGREVDRDVRSSPSARHARAGAERALEHVQRERRASAPVCSASGRNAPGAEQAALGVLPAHERLDAGRRAGREVDLRLVVQDQLVRARSRRAARRSARAARASGGRARARRPRSRCAPPWPGTSRRRRAAAASSASSPWSGSTRDADARVRSRPRGRRSRTASASATPMRRPSAARRRRRRRREQERELVAAEPRDQVASPSTRPQPRAELREQRGRRRGGRACR